jgi:Uma2 family endonuclease
MVEVKIGYRTVDIPYTVRVHGVTEAMFDELVDADTKAELLDGVMIVHSPTTIEHDDVSGFLRSLARGYADTKGAGKVLGPDALVHLATCRRFAPDLFFLRAGRMPRPRPKQFEGVPNWVAEVLSPSNREEDLEDKRPAYRQAGVEEIWFVDLENQQVLVDRKRRRSYVEEVVTSGKVVSNVLTGFWVNVAWLWAPELPSFPRCLRQILRGR